MNTWIALFRGINVGGRNILPMKDLRALLEENGCRDVATYIQSGNAAFRSSEPDRRALAARISDAVERKAGFEPNVLIRSADELESALRANPFPDAVADPKSLHLLFLEATPEDQRVDALKEVAAPSEAFALVGDVFYLHAPDGIARSKLAATVEKRLGVAATGRNWRTAGKLLEMAQSFG